jgi:hypothetical protein
MIELGLVAPVISDILEQLRSEPPRQKVGVLLLLGIGYLGCQITVSALVASAVGGAVAIAERARPYAVRVAVCTWFECMALGGYWLGKGFALHAFRRLTEAKGIWPPTLASDAELIGVAIAVFPALAPLVYLKYQSAPARIVLVLLTLLWLFFLQQLFLVLNILV